MRLDTLKNNLGIHKSHFHRHLIFWEILISVRFMKQINLSLSFPLRISWSLATRWAQKKSPSNYYFTFNFLVILAGTTIQIAQSIKLLPLNIIIELNFSWHVGVLMFSYYKNSRIKKEVRAHALKWLHPGIHSRFPALFCFYQHWGMRY